MKKTLISFLLACTAMASSLEVKWDCGVNGIIRPSDPVQVFLIGSNESKYGPVEAICQQNKANVPGNFLPGIYRARLIAKNNGHSVDSQPFRLNCHKKIVDGSSFINLQTFSSVYANVGDKASPPPPLFSLSYDALNQRVFVNMDCNSPNNQLKMNHPFHLDLFFKDLSSEQVRATKQQIIRCSDPIRFISVAHTIQMHLQPSSVDAPSSVLLEGMMRNPESTYSPTFSQPILIEISNRPLSHPQFQMEPYFMLSHSPDSDGCALKSKTSSSSHPWNDSAMPIEINSQDPTLHHHDHNSFN